VLYLDAPPDLIDVNVHPNKLSVKFVDAAPVKKLIYNTVRRALSSVRLPDFLQSAAEQREQTERAGVGAAAGKGAGYTEADTASAGHFSREVLEVVGEGAGERQAIQERPVFGEPAFYGRVPAAPYQGGAALHESEPATTPTRAELMRALDADEAADEEKTQDSRAQTDIPPQKSDGQADLKTADTKSKPAFSGFQEVADYNTVHVVGKLFNTYILIQVENDVYLIDQHAAHERILYDMYLKQIDSFPWTAQLLVFPHKFSVTEEEAEYLTALTEPLAKLGFILKHTAERTFSLTSLPLICTALDLDDFVTELLSDPQRTLKTSDFLKEKIAQASCKAAVKGRDDLSPVEIKSLIAQMSASNAVPLCPHGRPILVKLTKTEIEKWFKRIV
jgi:DNA mismatch repair protein MutL